MPKQSASNEQVIAIVTEAYATTSSEREMRPQPPAPPLLPRKPAGLLDSGHRRMGGSLREPAGSGRGDRTLGCASRLPHGGRDRSLPAAGENLAKAGMARSLAGQSRRRRRIRTVAHRNYSIKAGTRQTKAMIALQDRTAGAGADGPSRHLARVFERRGHPRRVASSARHGCVPGHAAITDSATIHTPPAPRGERHRTCSARSVHRCFAHQKAIIHRDLKPSNVLDHPGAGRQAADAQDHRLRRGEGDWRSA